MINPPLKTLPGSSGGPSSLFAFLRSTYSPVIAVLLVSVAAALFAWSWARDLDVVFARRQFGERGDKLVATISDRLKVSAQVLRGAVGMATVARGLSGDDWHNYVDQLDMERQYPGIQGIGYAPRVTSATLDGRVVTVPVTYIEPMSWRNQQALGFDMYADAAQRTAMERARDQGEVAASARVTLSQETPGFLLYMPIYAGGAVSADVAVRRSKLMGYAYASFSMHDFMAPLLNELDRDLIIRIRDFSAQGAGDGELFDSVPGANSSLPLFTLQKKLEFGGHVWLLSFSSTAALEENISRKRSDLIGIVVGLLSFFAVVITWLLSTARGRAEIRATQITRELRTSQERFHLAVRGANDGIWDRDLVTGITYFSPRIDEFLGLPAGTLSANQAVYARRIHEEDRPRWTEALRAHLRHGHAYDIEYRCRRADGSWGWFHSRGEAVRDETGRALRMVGALTDVTQRKESEAALARYRSFLDRVLDMLPGPMAVKDIQHRFVIVNDGFARMIGRSREDIVGKTSHDLFPAAGVDVGRAQDDEALKMVGPAKTEVVLMHAEFGEPRNLIMTKVATEGPDGETVILTSGQDVTDLRRALARFASAIQSTPLVAVMGIDRAGLVDYWNDTASAFYDYTEEEAMGRHVQDIFANDELAGANEEAMNEVWRTRKPLPPAEWKIRLKNGSWRWVYATIFPVLLEGEVVELFIMAVDITERRQAEAALMRRNAVLQAVIDNFPGGITLFDGEQNMIACNEEFKRLFTFPEALFTDHLPSLETLCRFESQRGEFGPGEVEEQVARRLAQAHLHRLQPHVLERRRPDGLVMEIRGMPLPEGGFVTTYMDITARKAAEQKLRELSEAVRQSPVSILITNLKGDIEYVNPKFERLTGYTLDEVRGRHPRFLNPEEDTQGMEAQVWRTVSAGGQWQGELQNVKKNGDLYWEYANILPLLDEAGNITHFLSVKEDITERKRAQEELAMHRDHLRELVAEQTAGLLAAKEAAERAYRAKSEFLANVSHELRTPMHAILSFAQLGRDKAEKAPREKLREHFERVHKSGERLLALVNSLLDLSKLEAGKMLVDARLQDVTSVIKEVFGELEPLAAAKRQTLKLVPSETPTQATVDPTRLAQVMRNLISNAIKFTPEGGGIAITVAQDTLVFGRRATDKAAVRALRITVSDAGIGIPEEELETIFDKFVQSNRTRSGAGGTGLGLAICKEIVEAHGGTVRAANNPQGGADLIVILPVELARRSRPLLEEVRVEGSYCDAAS